MRAVVCRTPNGLESLRLEEDWPEPVVASTDVLIDVKATALNFHDLLIMQGRYQLQPPLPFVVAAECSGVVSAVGSEVTRFAPGDSVVAEYPYGFLAQRAVAPSFRVTHAPRGLDFHVACASGLTYMTSYHALKQRGRLQAGQTLLVLGAAGGIGSAAIDIGRHLGAKVIAAASSDAKLNFARDIGASHVINYATEDLKLRVRELTDGRGVDVVLDPVGGAYTEAAVRSLAYKGRALVVGFANGEISRLPLNLPLLKSCDIVGVYLQPFIQHEPEEHTRNLQELADLFARGKLRPAVSSVFAMEEYRQAYELLAARRAMGKVVVSVSG